MLGHKREDRTETDRKKETKKCSQKLRDTDTSKQKQTQMENKKK